MLRINTEESDSDSASFYSFNTEFSDVKCSSKLTKHDSFKSFESVDKCDTSPYSESFKTQKDCIYSTTSQSRSEIAPENSVNVLIMSSNSESTPKMDISSAEKEQGKKKKGLRISFRRKKTIKKVIGIETGVSGTDSDLSSSNPVTPQVTPYGTLEKNVTPPWTTLEEKDNVGKLNQVSGKTQSEKRFGPFSILMRESKKQKEKALISLPNKSSLASELIQTQNGEANRKIITPDPSIANVEDFESVTDRVAVSEKVNLFQNLGKSSSADETGTVDENYTSTFYSSRKEKYVSINSGNEEGIDIAEGRINSKEQVEENIVPERVEYNLSDLKPVVKEIIEDVFKNVDKEIADSESKVDSVEMPADDAKSIADEIVEAELNENSLEKSCTENEIQELHTNKVTIRKKLFLGDKTTSLEYHRPNYLSFTDPTSMRSNSSRKFNSVSVSQSLTSTYPSFSSKIVISVEPNSTVSSSKANRGTLFEDSLNKNVDKPFIRFPKPLSFKHYAPFGKACMPKAYLSKSLSPSYSNDTEESFRIPKKLPTSYSNMYINSESDRSVEPVTNVESSGQLSDSWAVSSSDKKEHLYKILVIGELGTGKTSIIKRYVHQFFCQHYRATIGVDFALKVLNWDENTIIRLQLWDIAGQERYGNMTRVYYKQAVGAFVVFDVSNSKTFDAVTKWKNDLDSKVTLPDGSNIPTILLANKCDQPKEGIVSSPSKMDDFCREKNFAGWFETSAKEDINIEEATKFLISKILNNEEEGLMVDESFDKDKFSIDETKEAEEKKKCSC